MCTPFYLTLAVCAFRPPIIGTRGTGLFCVAFLSHQNKRRPVAGGGGQETHPLPVSNMEGRNIDQRMNPFVQQVRTRGPSPASLARLPHPQSIPRPSFFYRYVQALCPQFRTS